MAEPGVAMIIPVLDEVDTIAGLLDDCLAQRPAPSEVIVVDAGSTDGTLELLRAAERRWPALTVVEEPGATPGHGRNVGIRSSHASVLATLDAGSRVAPDWLATIAGVRLAGPQPCVAVGHAVADARSEFERAAGWFTLRGYKPPDRPGPLGVEFLPAGRNGYCFERAAWEAAGGYPPDLPWGEDKVFLRRVRAIGAEVVVAPAAQVRWRPRESLAAVYRQYQRYGRGDAAARVDRRNSLVTFALYGTGAVLAGRASRGGRGSRAMLVLAVPGYLGAFVVPAARDLRGGRAVAWVPVLRLTVDVAKMHGFLVGSLSA